MPFSIDPLTVPKPLILAEGPCGARQEGRTGAVSLLSDALLNETREHHTAVRKAAWHLCCDCTQHGSGSLSPRTAGKLPKFALFVRSGPSPRSPSWRAHVLPPGTIYTTSRLQGGDRPTWLKLQEGCDACRDTYLHFVISAAQHRGRAEPRQQWKRRADLSPASMCHLPLTGDIPVGVHPALTLLMVHVTYNEAILQKRVSTHDSFPAENSSVLPIIFTLTFRPFHMIFDLFPDAACECLHGQVLPCRLRPPLGMERRTDSGVPREWPPSSPLSQEVARSSIQQGNRPE